TMLSFGTVVGSITPCLWESPKLRDIRRRATCESPFRCARALAFSLRCLNRSHRMPPIGGSPDQPMPCGPSRLACYGTSPCAPIHVGPHGRRSHHDDPFLAASNFSSHPYHSFSTSSSGTCRTWASIMFSWRHNLCRTIFVRQATGTLQRIHNKSATST